ncbi:hypothetical protein DFS34DRAFT_625504 [Phlyctochytrium arcticum]|nr:hypothetical protein DFS34DRAFT_625504 [Phlyctochytrium arcticum]
MYQPPYQYGAPPGQGAYNGPPPAGYGGPPQGPGGYNGPPQGPPGGFNGPPPGPNGFPGHPSGPGGYGPPPGGMYRPPPGPGGGPPPGPYGFQQGPPGPYNGPPRPPFHPGMPPPGGMPMRPPFMGPGGHPTHPQNAPLPNRPDVAPPVQAPPPKPLTAEDKLTTVFVGAIAEGVTDVWMERILRLCGPIRNWRRMQDPSGKPKGFGFCVYELAESVSRALRIIGGEGEGEFSRGVELAVAGGVPKKLKLNVDEVARKHLEQYRTGRHNLADEEEDQRIREQVIKLAAEMRDDANRMEVDSFLHSIPDGGSGTRPGSPTPSSAPGRDELEDLPPDMPPEQRELISRQISMFRERSAAKDRQKKEQEERMRIERAQREKREDINRVRRLKQDEHGHHPPHHQQFSNYHGGHRDSRQQPGYDMDEEEEQRRLERRKLEAEQAFNERVSRWQRDEHSRITWFTGLDKEKEMEQEQLEARAQDLLRVMPVWDEDAQMKNDEDRRAFFARMHRIRRKEFDRDAQDRTEEQEELRRKASRSTHSDGEDMDETNGDASGNGVAPTNEVIIGKIMTKEERVQAVQDLIGIIPTDKDGLWTWSIKWDFFDETIKSKKICPWITKKIKEYVGEEEADLIAFVVDLLEKKSSAETVLEEMRGALDDEAEEFVIKLWRMLIYETEARSQGLG